MKHLVLALTAGLLFLLPLLQPLPATAFPSGSSIPSCHDDIAVNKTEPGTSPECTPTIMSQDKALEFMKNFSIRKIKEKWYLFINEAESSGALSAASRWQTISLMTSAVQSIFNDNADCLIVRAPQSSEEKQALLTGTYPERLIAAKARYMQGSREKKLQWPEYHHHMLYTLTVQ